VNIQPSLIANLIQYPLNSKLYVIEHKNFRRIEQLTTLFEQPEARKDRLTASGCPKRLAEYKFTCSLVSIELYH
jgi:hypothetical protein